MIEVRNQVTGEAKTFSSKQAISNFIAAGANAEDYKEDLDRLGTLPLPTEMSQANQAAFDERVKRISEAEGLSPAQAAELRNAGALGTGNDTPAAVNERPDRHLGGSSDVPGAVAQAQVDAPKLAAAALKAIKDGEDEARKFARAQAHVAEARKELQAKNAQEYGTPEDSAQKQADLAEGERKNAAVRAAAAGVVNVTVTAEELKSGRVAQANATSATEARVAAAAKQSKK